MGRTADDVSKIQQVIKLLQIISRFSILGISIAYSQISTCLPAESKIRPNIFPGWVFFLNHIEKSAIKLREKSKSQQVD